MRYITLVLLSVLSFGMPSCRKKQKEEEKDRYLSGKMVDSGNVPITNTSFVLYAVHTPSGFNDKESFKPFSFTSGSDGKFRVMFNLSGGASLVKVLYAGESFDGTPELFVKGGFGANETEIDAGVITSRDKQ